MHFDSPGRFEVVHSLLLMLGIATQLRFQIPGVGVRVIFQIPGFGVCLSLPLLLAPSPPTRVSGEGRAF